MPTPELTAADHARIEQLCPELRGILEAELAAGNRVATTFEGWGQIVMLAEHFRVAHPIDGTRLSFVEVHDPHYWKSQDSVKELDQHVACRF